MNKSQNRARVARMKCQLSAVTVRDRPSGKSQTRQRTQRGAGVRTHNYSQGEVGGERERREKVEVEGGREGEREGGRGGWKSELAALSRRDTQLVWIDK